ncbi:MAG: SWIM zinc finger family protein [Opitutaceae bacterium]
MLSPDQVTALAPDAASFKAGRALATPRKWVELGKDDGALWGLAQGSGKKPYYTQVALSDLATKCSCPSRKFPCKHALGLMFLAAENLQELTQNERPDWVSEWFASRDARLEKAAKRAESKATKKPKDEKAAAKRAQKKNDRIDEGVEHLEQVLLDCIRNGLGQDELSHSDYWESLARRMVDTQATGLAGYVRNLGELPNSQIGWESRLLHELGSLYLLLHSYKNRSQLNADLRAEVQQLVGSSPSKEGLLEQTGINDRWFVAARNQTEQDRLTHSATWLYGTESKRWALKLEFAVQPKRPIEHWPLGSTVETELIYYPGAHPDRVLPRNAAAMVKLNAPRPVPQAGFQQLLHDYADQLTTNPWRMRRPCYLAVRPTRKDDQNFLVDQTGNALPWAASPQEAVLLESLSGGHPISVCAEWNGQHLRLHSAEDGNAWLPITSLIS